MPRGRRITRVIAGATALSLLAAGCGSSKSGTSGSNTGSSKTTKLTFSLDFTIDGLHAPFFVAQSKGYYAAKGLDVTFKPGHGSSDAIHKVQSGVVPMALASATNVLLAMATDGPRLKVVGMLVRHTPAAIESLKSSNITEPKDLVGKSMGQAPAASIGLTGALFKKTGVPLSSVKIVNMQPSSEKPSLLAGKVDAVAIYAQVFADKTDQVNFIYVKDYGIDPYSSSIIVDPDFLAEHPDEVKSFVEATMQGLKYTVAHPDEAGAIVGKAAGTGTPFFVSEIKLMKDFWSGSDVTKSGYGTMTAQAWDATQQFNVKFGGQDHPLPAKDLTGLWTNDYLGELQY